MQGGAVSAPNPWVVQGLTTTVIEKKEKATLPDTGEEQALAPTTTLLI